MTDELDHEGFEGFLEANENIAVIPRMYFGQIGEIGNNALAAGRKRAEIDHANGSASQPDRDARPAL